MGKQAKNRSVRASREPFPDLGELDVCLKVKDIEASVEFYNKLGFRQAEGEREKGWSVQERHGVRIGLFDHHIEGNILNFRGGNIAEISKELERLGLNPYKVRILTDKGVGNVWVSDPDGNKIFFDSGPEEIERRKKKVARL